MLSTIDRLLAVSGVGCWSFVDGAVVWDETMLELFDVDAAPTDYPSYLATLHPDDQAAMHANIQRFMAQGSYEDIEHRILLRDGSVRWVYARGSAVLGPEGEVRGLEGLVMDITGRKALEEQLSLQASTDALTGLRNRRWLEEEGPREVAECSRGRAPFTLTLIDLDDFKQVNDGPGGHQLGDEVLKAVADRLRQAIRGGDALVRLGGDELLAVLPQTEGAAALAVSGRLLAAVSAGPLAGVDLTASGGLATWAEGDDLQTVLRRADRALYAAKAAGTGQLRSQLEEPPPTTDEAESS